MRTLLLLCAVGLFGAACSGGSGGGADDNGATWDAFCEQQAEHWTSCGRPEFECAPTSCISSIYDAKVLDDYTSCLLAQSCNELGGDDQCFGNAGKVNGQYPPANQTNIDACTAKYDSCGGSSGSFEFDWCAVFLPIVLPTISEQASSCLDKPCADSAACFTGLAETFSCLDD